MATVNLHTHSLRCKHAKGNPMDYAKAALEQGLHVLGMSDHTPFPDDRLLRTRMSIAELDDYIHEVRDAQTVFPQLRILLALECEYIPEFDEFYTALREEKGMDYLIGGVHTFFQDGEDQHFWGLVLMNQEGFRSYTDEYIRMLESGHFLFGAHPDLYGLAIDGWSVSAEECAERICSTAERLNMPLEINVSGWAKWEREAVRRGFVSVKEAQAAGESFPRRMPLDGFWRVAARHGIKAVINSDAHDPNMLTKYLNLGYDFAQSHGIEVIYPFGE